MFKTYQHTTSSPKANYFNSSHAIYIGFSVIGNRPYGWVLIQPGVEVTYKARNLIEIKPGFVANSGSGFELIIDPNYIPCKLPDGRGDAEPILTE